AEAEYVSLSACCAQVLWIRTQLTDYGFHFDKIPMYCDSKHSRTKHIDVRYHFIKEKVEKGTIELFFVRTESLSEDRFKYLVRRLGMRCLTPEELEGSSFGLTAFSDADHAGCIDSRKSTSGGIQFLGDKLVSWMSKKQNCTAISLAKAEYMALSASCAQVMWMRTQLQDYGFNYNKIPLYCDPPSAIAISCNPVQHSRTKHIHTRYHFIKEHVENGIIELYFVKTEYQLADMFTKALPEDRFKYLVRRIGMRCLTPAELEVLAKETA
nr:retrovirus-related Pol polyprotein from transposon TNT 1-94 [Tanacetum cinerariifolium]